MFGSVFFRAQRATFRNSTRSMFNFAKPFSRENIPVYGAIIGISALTFQVTVLHPWHDQLSEQFTEIEKLIKLLEESSAHLDQKLEKVMAMEKSVKAHERQILSHGEDILKMERTVLWKLDTLANSLKLDNAQLEEQISRLESGIVDETNDE